MSMQQLKKDPSMDEILASIREIISEDVKSISPTKPVPVSGRRGRNPVSAKQDILELTNAVDDELSRKVIINNNNDRKKREDFMTYTAHPNRHEALELSNEIRENGEFHSKSERRTVRMPSQKILTTENPSLKSNNSQVSEKIRQALTESDMISEEVLAKSSEALSALNELNKVHDSYSSHPPEIKGSQTIEELMSSLLRPMLKNWLDANLPSIVKVIVAEQVEKVMKQRLK